MKDQLKRALIAGDGETVNALTSALLASGASAREILDEALLPGMEVVGERMRRASASSPRCCSARAPCRARSTCSSRTSASGEAPAWAPS